MRGTYECKIGKHFSKEIWELVNTIQPSRWQWTERQASVVRI